MLKKMSLIVALLAVVPMASAAIVLQPSVTNVLAGDIVTFNIVTTAGELVQSMTIGQITDNGAGGTATPLAFHANLNKGVDIGSNGSAFEFPAGDILMATASMDLGTNAATGCR